MKKSRNPGNALQPLLNSTLNSRTSSKLSWSTSVGPWRSFCSLLHFPLMKLQGLRCKKRSTQFRLQSNCRPLCNCRLLHSCLLLCNWLLLHNHLTLCLCLHSLVPTKLQETGQTHRWTSAKYKQLLPDQKAVHEKISLPTWQRKLFSYEERSTSNVSGKCGKRALDSKRIDQIIRSCFEMFPLTNTENLHKAWQDCIKAIDTAGRSLSRKTKENLPWEYSIAGVYCLVVRTV